MYHHAKYPLWQIVRRTLVLIFLFGLFVEPLFAQEEKPKEQHRVKVTFIHPGYAEETFWNTMGDVMYAASKNLNMDLLIFYTKHDPQLLTTLATDVVTNDKPDYLIITNDALQAPGILDIAQKNKVPVLLLLNGLTSDQMPHIEQKVLDNIVGTIVANDRDSGYLMARSIFQKAEKIKEFQNIFTYRIVAINTDNTSPASKNREIGLLDALEEYPLVIMDDVSYAGLEKGKAKQIMQEKLKKFGQIHYLWAGSDEIALEAIQAMKENDIAQNKISAVLVSATGWSPAGFSAIKSGAIATDMGGSFMLGAWSMIVLLDHYHGHRFPASSKILAIPALTAMNESNLSEFESLFPKRDWSIIDFSFFSKYRNQERKEYDFSIDAVYDNVKAVRKLRKTGL